MGYTTTFKGTIELDPPLTREQADEINNFCEERHHRPEDSNRPPWDMPGLWCDWETDGQFIFWNGSEKSYDMFEWLQYLTERFFKPWDVKLTGEIGAEGERPGDIWKIKASGWNLKKVRARVVFEDDDGA